MAPALQRLAHPATRPYRALKVLLADFHPQRASALQASLEEQGLVVQRLGPGEMLADAVLAGA